MKMKKGFSTRKIGSHSLGQDFTKMVESGIINQHSFGFSVIKDHYDQKNKANELREVKDV